MSNNRKRNMKKLARNIITGTALAVGGLANVPQMSAAEQNGGVDAAGQPTAGVNGATIAGIATGIGGLALTGASLIVSHKDSEATREQTRIENERKSRLDAESSEREKAKAAKEKAMDESNLDDTGVTQAMNALNKLQERNGISQTWTKDKVRRTLAGGGLLTKRLIQAANNVAVETGANNFNKEFRDVLCTTKKGNELLEKILQNIPKHMGGAAIARMRTVHLNARCNAADAAAENKALPAHGNPDPYCSWISDAGQLVPAALPATTSGAAQQTGEAPGKKWNWRKEMVAAVDEALPPNLQNFKGMIPIGFVMGAPSDNAGATRGDIHLLAGGGGGAGASSFTKTLEYLSATAQAVTNLKEGKSNFAITIGKMQKEPNENEAPASRHGVYPIDLAGKIGELTAEKVKNLDKAIRKAWVENAVESAVENNVEEEDADF